MRLQPLHGKHAGSQNTQRAVPQLRVRSLHPNLSFSTISKLKVSSARRSLSTFSSCGGQQANHAPQRIPSRLVQRRVRPHQVADHLPGSNIESTFGRRTHRQGHGTLRAEADALRSRLLPRSDPDRLRKKINRDRFLSRLNLAITTKAKGILQVVLPRQSRRCFDTGVIPRSGASTQRDSTPPELARNRLGQSQPGVQYSPA